MEIKNNLKRIREEKAISIEELSSLTSINIETLSEYEENKSTINLEDIIKISKALNVSIDSLINNEEEELKEETIETDDFTQFEEVESRRIKRSKVTLIKVWLIIGSILSPLSLASSMINVLGVYGVIFLSMYAITIPLLIVSINVMNKTSKKSSLIILGILDIIFLTFVGGIIMLCISDDDFERCTKKVDKRKKEGCEPIKKIKKLFNKDKANVNKLKIKKVLLIIGITLAALLILYVTLFIIFKIKEKNDREERYNELVNMMEYYDNSNRYKIDSSIYALEGYYDLTDIKARFKTETYYNDLINTIGNYSNTSTQINNLKTYLSYLTDDYKDVKLIRKDYENMLVYISSIISNKWCVGSEESSVCSSNRTYIKYLYEKANSSGYWNYDNYVKSINISYLVYGVKLYNGSYSFKWYYDTSDASEHLNRNIPMLPSYDSETSYYFNKKYSSDDNTLYFYLVLQSNSNAKVDMFKINSVYYDKENKVFKADVYLYGIGESREFTFAV